MLSAFPASRDHWTTKYCRRAKNLVAASNLTWISTLETPSDSVGVCILHCCHCGFLTSRNPQAGYNLQLMVLREAALLPRTLPINIYLDPTCTSYFMLGWRAFFRLAGRQHSERSNMARISQVFYPLLLFSSRSNVLSAPLLRVSAKREVILTAGPIGTPHILLNSGIGDSKYLKSLGIPALVDLPSVGRNASDQPAQVNVWSVNSNNTFDTIFRSDSREMNEWATKGTGPLVDTIANQLAFFRSDNVLKSLKIPDPAPGPNSPHLEMFFAVSLCSAYPFFCRTDQDLQDGKLFPDQGTSNFLSIISTLVSPTSRRS